MAEQQGISEEEVFGAIRKNVPFIIEQGYEEQPRLEKDNKKP